MKPVCNPATAEWFDYPRAGEIWAPRVQLAMDLCAGCPLRAACLQSGMQGKESGVWGGQLLDGGRVVKQPREPVDIPEDPETLKAAHAAFTRGERDQWTRLAERAYQRLKKREQNRRKREQVAA